jgi:hypothetical protein
MAKVELTRDEAAIAHALVEISQAMESLHNAAKFFEQAEDLRIYMLSVTMQEIRLTIAGTSKALREKYPKLLTTDDK